MQLVSFIKSRRLLIQLSGNLLQMGITSSANRFCFSIVIFKDNVGVNTECRESFVKQLYHMYTVMSWLEHLILEFSTGGKINRVGIFVLFLGTGRNVFLYIVRIEGEQVTWESFPVVVTTDRDLVCVVPGRGVDKNTSWMSFYAGFACVIMYVLAEYRVVLVAVVFFFIVNNMLVF